MNELEKPWGNENVFEWYYRESTKDILINIESTNIQLSIIDAIAGIYKIINNGEPEKAMEFLYVLGELLIADSEGVGKVVIDEVVVQAEMLDFEKNVEHMLQHAEEERKDEI